MRLRFQLQGVRCFVENEYECARVRSVLKMDDGCAMNSAPLCGGCRAENI